MKFVSERDLAFFHAVNRELIQDVVQQEIFYYQIMAEKTKKDDLYNESVRKVWANPVKVNALILYENSTEVITALPPDSKFNIDVFFHKKELEERNLNPAMGDFVRFGKIMYEILNVSEPQPIAGMINEQMMIKCPCTPARRGQFAPQAEGNLEVGSGIGFTPGTTIGGE